MIEIEHVSLTIKRAEILKDVSATFARGGIHGLIGRNGSGKTMLMKCICGFIHPTGGEIRVEGKRVGRDVDFPTGMGLLIETPGFIPYYTGFHNLKLLAGLNSRLTPSELRGAMEAVGLSPDQDKPVRKYSLGMRQRLGIAQAIMEGPELLILDEPMNGLDKQGLAEMRALLQRLKSEGKTILMSSHNAEDIELLCDTVCEMDRGRLTRL